MKFYIFKVVLFLEEKIVTIVYPHPSKRGTETPFARENRTEASKSNAGQIWLLTRKGLAFCFFRFVFFLFSFLLDSNEKAEKKKKRKEFK